MSIKGRNAVVTGSTSGIGLGIARALAKEGANVMLNGFGEKATIEKERAGIARQFSVEVLHNGADMSKPHEITAMIEEAKAKLGSVDVLVNNAGIQFVSPVEDFPDDKWEAIIRINLVAVFHATKAVLSGDEGAKMGPHHQHGLGPFARRLALQIGLCGRKARCCRLHQDDRARSGDLSA